MVLKLSNEGRSFAKYEILLLSSVDIAMNVSSRGNVRPYSKFK